MVGQSKVRMLKSMVQHPSYFSNAIMKIPKRVFETLDGQGHLSVRQAQSQVKDSVDSLDLSTQRFSQNILLLLSQIILKMVW